MAKTASDTLKIAAAELGNTSGLKYWNYVFPQWKFVDGNVTPYCACFVSWVMSRAGVGVKGLPSGYCPSIRNANSPLLDVGKSKAGDIVLFDWQGDGICDHIGLVEFNTGSYIQTIEGNTLGGQVARRTRQYGSCAGVIRPAYAEDEPKEKTPEKPKEKAKKTISQLAEEVIAGKWGIGSDRFNRLTAAGYNASAVQDAVNSKLGKKKGTRYVVDTPKGLNVRTGAGTSYRVLKALPYGTEVTVTKTNGNWGYIGDGWCSMQFLKKVR